VIEPLVKKAHVKRLARLLRPRKQKTKEESKLRRNKRYYTPQHKHPMADQIMHPLQFPVKRERQLADVVLLSVMSKQGGFLSTLPESDEQYASQAARELSVIGCIPVSAARRILSLIHIHSNVDLRNYLKTHQNFRVLSAAEFLKTHDCKNGKGVVLGTDFVRLFNIAAIHQDRIGGLQKMLLQYDNSARDKLMLWFFKFGAIFGTLGGWIPNEIHDCERPEASSMMKVVQNALNQFLLDSWNTGTMMAQEGDDFSVANMCDAWNITCEVAKVQVQELYGVILERRKHCKTHRRARTEHEPLTAQDLEENCSIWCQMVLQEFLGWVYKKLKPFVAVSEFMGCINRTAEDVYLRLVREVSIKVEHPRECSRFNGSRLQELLEVIDRGAFNLTNPD